MDRLLVSPASQRGRDFAVILSCLNELGYAVEWRVINAADYGMPQRRRRVYILAYHSSTKLYKYVKKDNPKDVVLKKGVLAESFPIIKNEIKWSEGEINTDKKKVTNEFNLGEKKSPFMNSELFKLYE